MNLAAEKWKWARSQHAGSWESKDNKKAKNKKGSYRHIIKPKLGRCEHPCPSRNGGKASAQDRTRLRSPTSSNQFERARYLSPGQFVGFRACKRVAAITSLIMQWHHGRELLSIDRLRSHGPSPAPFQKVAEKSERSRSPEWRTGFFPFASSRVVMDLAMA
jgi:hypothetical protein